MGQLPEVLGSLVRWTERGIIRTQPVSVGAASWT
jgi:hypothetical protein